MRFNGIPHFVGGDGLGSRAQNLSQWLPIFLLRSGEKSITKMRKNRPTNHTNSILILSLPHIDYLKKEKNQLNRQIFESVNFKNGFFILFSFFILKY